MEWGLEVEKRKNSMKKFVFMVLCALGLLGANAQTGVYKTGVPSITMGGDFNNGTGDTSTKAYGLTSAGGRTAVSTFPVMSARLDSTTHTAAANDSVCAKLSGYYNSVTLEIRAVQVGAVRCDSTTFYVWGSASGVSPGKGVLKQLTSFTMANTTNQQIFQYTFNTTGGGWPYTGLRVTAVNGNLSTNSNCAWQPFLLIR